MKPEIKTRENGTVKAIDTSAVAAERISGGTETAARETVRRLDKFGRRGAAAVT